MLKQKTYPLTWHLVGLVLASMIPLFIFSSVMISRLVQNERDVGERRLMRASQELASSLDQEVDTTIRTLQAMSVSEALGRQDLRSFHYQAQEVLRTQPTWKTILLHSTHSKILLSANRKFGEKPMLPNDPDSLRKVLETKQPAVGGLTLETSSAKQPGTLAFAIRVPVWRGQQVAYVLSAVIPTDSLQKIVGQDLSAEEWTRTLLDSQGAIAARSRSPEDYLGKKASQMFLQNTASSSQGLRQQTSMDGEAVYVAYQRARFSKWMAIVAVPTKTLDSKANHVKWIVGLVGILLFIVFGGLALLAARYLAKRIQSASKGAMDLIAGKIPVIEESKVLEVEQLRESLQKAADLIRLRETERNQHLAAALEARAEAENANRAKSTFLANMSHEVRTPLGIVLGFADVIAQDMASPEEKQRNLEIVQRNGRQLLRLIDDILDLSKVEAEKLSIDLKEFSLSELISDLVAEFTPKAQAKKIELVLKTEGHIPERIVSDSLRLKQILQNVLSNSIKFTDKGKIQIQIVGSDQWVDVLVKDSGVGIAKDQQKKLFSIFSQAEAGHSRKYGGTGLGLALSQKLARLLGGDLWLASSEPGRGSVFQLRIKINNRSH